MGRWGDGEMGRWGDREIGRLAEEKVVPLSATWYKKFDSSLPCPVHTLCKIHPWRRNLIVSGALINNF
ncbi:hypothetical protein [Moorena producens]|uniref:hypothetical protein n=1 Tax=Moorena producens TaxID=1155739 RepID=UPI003C70CAAB